METQAIIVVRICGSFVPTVTAHSALIRRGIAAAVATTGDSDTRMASPIDAPAASVSEITFDPLACQGECSTTELRRPVLTGDSLTAQSSWSELSWSMIRCDRTVRVDERRDGRRPGSGIRSAMLLSGLTTMGSDIT